MSIRNTIVTSLAVAAAVDVGPIGLVVCPLGQRRRRPRSLFEISRRRRTSGQVRYPGDHPKSYCTLYWTLSHFRVLYTRPTWGGRIMRRRECRHCDKRACPP